MNKKDYFLIASMILTVCLCFNALIDKDWSEALAWATVTFYEFLELGESFNQKQG